MKRREKMFEEIASSKEIEKSIKQTHSSHPDIETLHAFAFGWLNTDQAEKIHSHLILCDACAGEVTLTRSMDKEIIESFKRVSSEENQKQEEANSSFRNIGLIKEWLKETFSQPFSLRPAAGLLVVTLIVIGLYYNPWQSTPFKSMEKVLNQPVSSSISPYTHVDAKWFPGRTRLRGSAVTLKESSVQHAFSLGVDLQRLIIAGRRPQPALDKELTTISRRLEEVKASPTLMKMAKKLSISTAQGEPVQKQINRLVNDISAASFSTTSHHFLEFGRWCFALYHNAATLRYSSEGTVQLKERLEMLRNRDFTTVMRQEIDTVIPSNFLKKSVVLQSLEGLGKDKAGSFFSSDELDKQIDQMVFLLDLFYLPRSLSEHP